MNKRKKIIVDLTENNPDWLREAPNPQTAKALANEERRAEIRAKHRDKWLAERRKARE